MGWFFSAAVYGFLAWTAVSFVLADGSGGAGGPGSTIEELSRQLMESTAGRWLLGLGGLVALGVAGYFAYKGIDRKYLDEIDLSPASHAEREAMEKLGMAGRPARRLRQLVGDHPGLWWPGSA